MGLANLFSSVVGKLQVYDNVQVCCSRPWTARAALWWMRRRYTNHAAGRTTPPAACASSQCSMQTTRQCAAPSVKDRRLRKDTLACACINI